MGGERDVTGFCDRAAHSLWASRYAEAAAVTDRSSWPLAVADDSISGARSSTSVNIDRPGPLPLTERRSISRLSRHAGSRVKLSKSSRFPFPRATP